MTAKRHDPELVKLATATATGLWPGLKSSREQNMNLILAALEQAVSAAEARGEQRGREALRPAAETLRKWLKNDEATMPLETLDALWEFADWVFPELARAEKGE